VTRKICVLAMLLWAALCPIDKGWAQTRTDTAIGMQDRRAAQILILGTYHMGNPRLDSTNIEADDVLSARRQKELSELADELARFRPTKVAIEARYGSTVWTERYQKYLAGEYRLGRNEIEQIGFRVAKLCGLTTVNPVDFPMFMNGLTPDEVEEKDNPPAKPTSPRPLSEEEKLLRRSTVTEFLKQLNSPEAIAKDHAQYMQMLRSTDDPRLYFRADLVANWYKRNLRIFANVNRITRFPSDRVLLIIGSGHLKLLREFATDSPQFRLEDLDDYLR